MQKVNVITTLILNFQLTDYSRKFSKTFEGELGMDKGHSFPVAPSTFSKSMVMAKVEEYPKWVFEETVQRKIVTARFNSDGELKTINTTEDSLTKEFMRDGWLVES